MTNMLKRTKKVDAFKIRVIYKSGAMMDFDVLSLKITGGDWTWENIPNAKIRPVRMGVDEVAAVWQLDTFQLEVEDLS